MDLKIVQEQFLTSRDAPPTTVNMPPIAGALTWCRGLVERITIPMRKLQELDRTILEREEAKEVHKVYNTIAASLQEYENQRIEEWGRDVEASSSAKLKLPLMLRHPETRHLSTPVADHPGERDPTRVAVSALPGLPEHPESTTVGSDLVAA